MGNKYGYPMEAQKGFLMIFNLLIVTKLVEGSD